MTEIPNAVPTTLARFLAGSRAPLGQMTVAGHDLGALILTERDPDILQKTAARAASTGDVRWQIAAAERQLALKFEPELAMALCGWLIDADRIEAAQDLLAGFPHKLPSHLDERRVHLKMRVALARGSFAEVAAALCRDRFDLGRVMDAGWACLSGGAWRELGALVARARREAPHMADVVALGLRCTSVFDGPQVALERLLGQSGPISVGSRLHAELTAQFLGDLGRFSEALDVVEGAITRHPTAWSLYGMAESYAVQSDRSDTLAAILDRGIRLFPDQPRLLSHAINHAADTARMGAAEVLLDRLRVVSDWGWHEARIGVLCQAGDTSEIDRAHRDAKAAGLPAGSAELVIAGFDYFFQARDGGLARAAALIEPLAPRFSHDAGYQCLRLRLMLAEGRESEALKLHAELPRGLAESYHLAAFGFLADLRADRTEQAQAGWSRHLGSSSHIAVNARSAYPETISERWRGGKGDVLLFAVVFNALEYLDWFLAHYRALGVNHFFIVDNGSTDGTFDHLQRQSDVSLFRQTRSFRAAGCGIFWINHLIRRYGVDHWCFQVDMDEAFVFPGMEHGRSLRDLLSFADAKGWRSVPAMMLDIYPATLDATPAEDPFASSRYFDTDYFAFPNEIPPYQFIQGGVRARLSGRSLMMTKAPLVRPTRDFAYLANNHQHTHLAIAKVTGALLHYKFIGNLMQRVDEAIVREEHFMGARFYRALRDPLADAAARTGLTSEFSRVYGTPADLVVAGLMTTSVEWDAWASHRAEDAVAPGQ